MSRVPPEVRELVVRRADGRCERCGATGLEVHHRQARGMGGGDGREHAVANLVLLCRRDHRWLTEHPREAALDGWVVRRPTPPASVPVRLWGPRTMWLAEDGSYSTQAPG